MVKKSTSIKTGIKTVRFTDPEIYLPVTMKQFETLTNEILAGLNIVADDGDNTGFTPEYVAQVLMSAIHALKHETGKTNKWDLFASCVNRISCHVTYHVVEEIQAKIKASAIPAADTDAELSTETTAVEQETAATLQ